MSLAEVLARLGTALVTWLCVYAYIIWFATLRVVTCEAGGDRLWAVLLGFGVLAAALAGLLSLTRPLEEAHAVMRWFAWPPLLLLPLVLPPLGNAWLDSTLGGAPLCPTAVLRDWHAWWAPVQTLILGVMGTAVYRAWRPSRRAP